MCIVPLVRILVYVIVPKQSFCPFSRDVLIYRFAGHLTMELCLISILFAVLARSIAFFRPPNVDHEEGVDHSTTG